MSLSKDQILNIALATPALPTLPQVASKILQLTSKEETSISDLSKIVETDSALSADVLKVVNSAYYGLPSKIRTIPQATALLGMTTIRSVVLSFSFLDDRKAKSDFDFPAFWKESLAGAVAARMLMQEFDKMAAEDVFVSALLRNIGEVIFIQHFADKLPLIQSAIHEGIPLEQAEEAMIGISHGELGSELLQRWNFPPVLIYPVMFHHDPERAPSDSFNTRNRTSCLYLGDRIAKLLYHDDATMYYSEFQESAKRLLQFSDINLTNIIEYVHDQINAAVSSFGLSFPPAKSVAEILQEANRKLLQMNLHAEETNRQYERTKQQLEVLTEDLEQRNRNLTELANRDGLTGVYNHRYLQDKIDREMNRSSRNNETFGIIMIDIDRFKNFNDMYGHQIGDFILQEFCRVIRRNVRNYDLLARYGGEEFVLILPETSEENSMMIAEKLRRLIEIHTFTDRHGMKYTVSASFGVTVFSSGDSLTKAELLRRVDLALYAAKESRNAVRTWEPSMVA